MKRFIGALALTAVLAMPAQGQFADGVTGTATYTGATDRVNTPFFQFDIEIDGFAKFNWDFICVDQQRYLDTGSSGFGMQLFSLESSLLPSVLSGGLAVNGAYQINNLKRVALLYDKIKEDGLGGSTAAQDAIWYMNGTGTKSFSQLSQASKDLVAYVDGIDIAGRSFADYYLMFDLANYSEADGWNFGSAPGGNQPQLTHYSVPEPGTLFLLGSGLLGVAYAGRRRKENEA